jgi:hypothetical protein
MAENAAEGAASSELQAPTQAGRHATMKAAIVVKEDRLR